MSTVTSSPNTEWPAAPWAAARTFRSARLTHADRKALLAVVDLALLNASLLVAATLWNGFALSVPAVVSTAKWHITLWLVWAGLSMVLDLYNLARAASAANIVPGAALGALLTALIYLAIPWLTPPVQTRTFAFAFAGLAVVTVTGWRAAYALLISQPAFSRRVLIVGVGPLARDLARDLNRARLAGKANPFQGTGNHVVGLVAERPLVPERPVSEVDGAAGDCPILGQAVQLVQLVRQYSADEVIVALEPACEPEIELSQALLDCRELGVQLSSYEAVYERLTARVPMSHAQYDTRMFLGLSDTPTARLYQAAKRLMDIAFALTGLAATGLLAPMVALGNALWSPGPLVYRQQRVGQGGRPFAMLKFRTMRRDAELESGAVWSQAGDPRVTPLGRWLRRGRLDELPQALNILRGEMSLVGPRPERPHFVGLLAHQMPIYRVRHSVRPGLTGWAQIRYHYGNTEHDARAKLEYDLYYIKHANLALDLEIILQTAPVMLFGQEN